MIRLRFVLGWAGVMMVVAFVLAVYAADSGGRGTFTDTRDGKRYRTVKIGNRVWMVDNLNFKTNGSWCYDDNESNCRKYGRLYDFETARIKACPTGWRLPTNEDWEALAWAAGGWEIAGKKLKTKTGWYNNGNGTNDFGFSALPGGYRSVDVISGYGYDDGDDYAEVSFESIGKEGGWWTSTVRNSKHPNCWYMDYRIDGAHDGYANVESAFSVRCVQGAEDEETIGD
jgi:uncharacterized protein (TIGR02145 family)